MSEENSLSTPKISNSCDICNKDFQSKTHLERHKARKTPCLPVINKNNTSNEIFDAIKKMIDSPEFSTETMELIRAYLDNKEAEIKKHAYQCNNCGIRFNHKQSLYKHKILQRCSKVDDTNNEQLNNATGNILTDNTIQNSNVSINSSITNNITNITNINIGINPFGLETIEHITLKDFKYIFSDTTRIMDKLCHLVFTRKLSNISFYKYNLNKQIISFLSKNMEIEKIDENDFIQQFKHLLEDTCILLFYQYREHLNKDELIKYMKKLVEYQESILYDGDNIMNKITKSCILRLMDSAFRNKDIKNSIEKIIRDLKTNPEAHKIIKKFIKTEKKKRNTIINEYYYKDSNELNESNESNESNEENKYENENDIDNDNEDKNDEENEFDNGKLLYKLRSKAIKEYKNDEKKRNKKISESVFENVNFENVD